MAHRAAWNLPIDEVSGLGRRRNPWTGHPELLAIGDREPAVATLPADGAGGLPLDGDHRKAAERWDVTGLPEELRGSHGQSDWEGVAGDAAGRVFVLRETGSELLVLSPTFELETVVALRWEKDRGSTLESVLLLEDGHLLSITQERPLQLLEFAAPGAHFSDLGPTAPLPHDEPMRLPAGRELHAVASWALLDDRLQSANDLAVSGGRLFVISSLSRCIARFPLPRAETDILEPDSVWQLPKDVAAGHGKAEGLIVDEEFGILVGVDRQPGERGPNLHDLGHTWLGERPRRGNSPLR